MKVTTTSGRLESRRTSGDWDPADQKNSISTSGGGTGEPAHRAPEQVRNSWNPRSLTLGSKGETENRRSGFKSFTQGLPALDGFPHLTSWAPVPVYPVEDYGLIPWKGSNTVSGGGEPGSAYSRGRGRKRRIGKLLHSEASAPWALWPTCFPEH